MNRPASYNSQLANILESEDSTELYVKFIFGVETYKRILKSLFFHQI